MKAKQLIEELKALVEPGSDPDVLVTASGDVFDQVSLWFEEYKKAIVISAYEKR